ncbi:MAG TPA: PEP-CTERM sorting domain-containing protein [Granulicella sp.]
MTLSTGLKRISVLMAFFLFLVTAPALHADTLNWTWGFTGHTDPNNTSSPSVFGNGTFTSTALDTATNSYTILTLDGQWFSNPATNPSPLTVSGPLAAGTLNGNDNKIIAGILDVDSNGLLFETSNGVEWLITPNSIYVNSAAGSSTYFGTFFVSQVASPVPEPSSIMLLGTAFVALASLLWYRKQNHAVVNAA